MSKRSARPRPQNSVDGEGFRDRCQAFAQREIGPRWQKAEPHVRAGKLRALALSGEARLSILPEVPTFAEAGLPDFNANSWLGVIVRAGTPPELVAKIGAAAAQVMKDPEVRQQLLAMGVDPVGSSPAQFAQFLDTEIVRYAAAVKAAGIKLD